MLKMDNKQTSEKKILINCDVKTLWSVLTESKYTKVYMFNCTVSSDWKIGNPIIWEGNYQGYQAYQKGEILDIKPFELIKYSTFDPNFGLEDKPENYIHISYILKGNGNETELTIINETFDGNSERMNHINQGWEMVVSNIKEVAEGLN
jgi:uncharacterized protein YndB with AHSA1/START domain